MGISTGSAPDFHSKAAGCLVGGALGDALGAPLEFLKGDEVSERWPDGVPGYVPCYGRIGAITDDTQMTLFTAEALALATREVARLADPAAVAACLHRGYLRWLKTQRSSSRSPEWKRALQEGWLLKEPGLYAARAPGVTCLTALAGDRAGSVQRSLNGSKGCGGVMRSAPCGLAAAMMMPRNPDGAAAFAMKLGNASAAITHGAPSAYLPAGFLAALVAQLCLGVSLDSSIAVAQNLLARELGHEETLSLIEEAVMLARTAAAPADAFARLGAGWVGHEALAIALYAALLHEQNVLRALSVSVSHGGDSDSTGSICGNILGALHGYAALPPELCAQLELRDLIVKTAQVLVQACWPC